MPYRPLSKELQQKAENELHEVPARIQEDLEYIQKWLSTQPHLKAKTDDQWLLSFLRSSKFNYQRTKEKLNLFYKNRTKIPEFFANRDPYSPEIQEVLKRGIITVLQESADAAGPKILLIRTECCDAVKAPAIVIVKVLLMILEVLYFEDDNSAVAGLRFIVNLKSLPYKYLLQCTPDFMKKTVSCTINAYPTRIKGAHFAYSPWFFDFIYGLLRVFLPQKIKDRLQFHNDFNNMCRDIPLSILPIDYGGEGNSCDEIAAEWKLKVESYKDWFTEDAQYCSNEIKQPKAETSEQILDPKEPFEKLEE